MEWNKELEKHNIDAALLKECLKIIGSNLNHFDTDSKKIPDKIIDFFKQLLSIGIKELKTVSSKDKLYVWKPKIEKLLLNKEEGSVD